MQQFTFTRCSSRCLAVFWGLLLVSTKTTYAQLLPQCDPNKIFEECDAEDDKVCVTVSTESLDPCSPQWIYDFINNVIPAVGDIIQVRRYLDGTALPPGQACVGEQPMAFHVCTFHGAVERSVQNYEACVQHFAHEVGLEDEGHRASLEFTYCTHGVCSGPGTGCLGLEFCEFTGSLLSTEGFARAEACVEQINSTNNSTAALVWTDIHDCAQDVLGENLHWKSSKYLNDIGLTFGALGLPPVLINGKIVTTFFDCDSHVTQLDYLIQEICEAYQGNNTPTACLQFLTDEELPASKRGLSWSRWMKGTQNMISRYANAGRGEKHDQH